MLDKINSIEERYEEINRQIAENVDDYQVTVELMKERAEIEDVVEKGRQYKEILRRIAEARELQHDPEMAGGRIPRPRDGGPGRRAVHRPGGGGGPRRDDKR